MHCNALHRTFHQCNAQYSITVHLIAVQCIPWPWAGGEGSTWGWLENWKTCSVRTNGAGGATISLAGNRGGEDGKYILLHTDNSLAFWLFRWPLGNCSLSCKYEAFLLPFFAALAKNGIFRRFFLIFRNHTLLGAEVFCVEFSASRRFFWAIKNGF